MKRVILILVACIQGFALYAQVSRAVLQQSIQKSTQAGNSSIKEFYEHCNYLTVWVQTENTPNLLIFFDLLKQAAGHGLRGEDYGYPYIQALLNGSLTLANTDDSVEAELRITDAAIHFFTDMAYGNTVPYFGYYGLSYTPGCYNIPALLAAYISENTLQSLSGYLSPPLPEITAMARQIKWFNTIMADTSFKEVIIISNKVTTTNKPLLVKLYQLGIFVMADSIMPDPVLINKVKEAQLQFTLTNDGTLHSTTLKALNIPVSVRLQQLNLSINYYRWLNCFMQNRSVITVNIPAAYLKVYHNTAVILEMRLIVGKKTTPTPTLISKVDEVVLYPYWHVPYSIATKEFLPLIQRSPKFIDNGNYQVLNKAGRVVDPYSIDWHALSRSNFPYTLRQSTGCDNALGLLKLDFYSPFGVYLHDTPTKILFRLNRRFLSHGCMRMEKPMELGHLILNRNPAAIDTLDISGNLRNQSPTTVHADEHMPVVVWYNPAGMDTTGRVLYYEDVYEKFNWMKAK